MPISIAHKKRSPERIAKELGPCSIIDVTSKSKDKFLPLSPFYPHGNIPVALSQGYLSQSVEGIWQGLKVFKNQDVDVSKFSVTSMKGIKRTVRSLGLPLGHRNGVKGDKLLDYLEARKTIYLPSYEWMLKNKASSLVEELHTLSKQTHLVLLDYETNSDINNLQKPLSHAALIKIYIENNFSLDHLIG